MKRALILFALLTGACTVAHSPEPAAAPAPPAACALTISFGSYAMGIDHETFTAVESLLAHDKGVTSTTQKRWGREGEVTVCAQTRGAADNARLFGEIATLFPKKPRGPLTVETADGRTFAAGATP